MLTSHFASALLLVTALSSTAAAQATPAAVAVSVEAQRDLTLHEGDLRLCRGPCSLQLDLGRHVLGVSRGRGEIHLTPPIEIDRPGTLRVEHVSRSGSRMGGWIAFTFGAITGAACGVVGAIEIDKATTRMESALQTTFGITMLAAGGLHLLIGVLVGLPLAAAGDGAVVRFD